MNEEIFDVVDGSDSVVGQRSRSEVHRLGLKHRAIHVLVYNQRGELFLQKRSMSMDTFPGAWDSSASGHLDCGEDYDRCAAREMKEELGFQPARPVERLFKIKACQETGQEFIWVYRCIGEGPFQLHPEEIETGKWVSPSELTAWMEKAPEDFASALRLIWKKLQTSDSQS